MDIKHPHLDLSFHMFIQTLHVTGDFSLLNQRRCDKEPSAFKWKHSSEKREQLGINVAVWHQHSLVFGPVSSTSKHTCSRYTEYKEILEITQVSVIGALCWREVLKCWAGNPEYATVWHMEQFSVNPIINHTGPCHCDQQSRLICWKRLHE